MIERRDVLKACLVAGALPLLGCSRPEEKEQNPPAPQDAGHGAAGAASTNRSIDLIFRGLTFFLIPADSTKKLVHVALVKNDYNSTRKPHLGTLRVPRVAVSNFSDAVPVAADELHVYFSLAGQALRIIPREKEDPAQWGPMVSADLAVGREPVKDLEPVKCGNDTWGSMNWLIDFKKDLFPDAVLAPDWQTRPALFGRVELTHGELEDKKFGKDGQKHYTYELKNTKGQTKRRLTKDSVRYRLAADFVQLQFGAKSCILDTSKRYLTPSGQPLSLTLDHVPAYWMDPTTGPLTDFESLYELMENKGVKGLTARAVPTGRQQCDPSTSNASAGCVCCPTAGMFI